MAQSRMTAVGDVIVGFLVVEEACQNSAACLISLHEHMLFSAVISWPKAEIQPQCGCILYSALIEV